MTRKDRVLRYINRIRVKHGIGAPLDELPKGKRWKPSCCPVGRAVNGWTEASYVVVPTPQGEVVVKAPKYVREFICAFDLGDYPELVEQ